MPSAKRSRSSTMDDQAGSRKRARIPIETATILTPDAAASTFTSDKVVELPNDQASKTMQESMLDCMSSDIQALRRNLECKICFRMLYEPYTSSCGHTSCYSCLNQWFKDKKSCPECRVCIRAPPAPSYLIRDMVHHFTNRADLLPDGETVEFHQKLMQEETELITEHRENQLGLFDGIFNRAGPHLWTLDPEDEGITRCNVCHWEVVDGQCHCTRYDLESDQEGMESELDYDLDQEQDGSLNSYSENLSNHGITRIGGSPAPHELNHARYNIASGFQSASSLHAQQMRSGSVTASNSSREYPPHALIDIEASVSGSEGSDSEEDDEDEEETSSIRNFVASDDEDVDEVQDDEDDNDQDDEDDNAPVPYTRTHRFVGRHGLDPDRARRNARLVDSDSEGNESVDSASGDEDTAVPPRRPARYAINDDSDDQSGTDVEVLSRRPVKARRPRAIDLDDDDSADSEDDDDTHVQPHAHQYSDEDDGPSSNSSHASASDDDDDDDDQGVYQGHTRTHDGAREYHGEPRSSFAMHWGL